MSSLPAEAPQVNVGAAGARYLPFDGGHFRLSMGLIPLQRREWIGIDDHLASALAAKRTLLRTRHDQVFAVLPEALAAADELLQMLAEHLVEHHPSVFCRDGERLLNLATGENWSLALPRGSPSQLHPLDIAGRLVAEDFCLLMPDTAHPTQGYRLVGASLCSPSAWRLADKIARPLGAIHQPVPGYVEKLARPVDRLFAQLKPDRLMGRFNWIVTDSPAAFRPFRPPIATPGQGWNAGAELWLRVERQTIQRLPMTGAILFTIRTHITRLDAAIRTADNASELAAAIREMPAATEHYRDITPVVPALLDWLDRRAVEYAKLPASA